MFLTTSFRTKIFVASVSAAAVSLVVVALLLTAQVRQRERGAIQQRLTDEARLIAGLLTTAPVQDEAALDREADRLGQDTEAQVLGHVAQGGLDEVDHGVPGALVGHRQQGRHDLALEPEHRRQR